MATPPLPHQPPLGKNFPARLIVAIEDVNDLWETVRGNLEARVPFKKSSLNNKARNLVLVDRLHVEFVQTTDARLRRGLPEKQSSLSFGFRRPYAWVILVTCDDLDEYKNLLKPRLKTIVQAEDHEWFIVFVSKATADNAVKLSKRVYSRIEGDFSSKKRERCCKVDLHGADTSVWEDIELKIVECIRHTLDRRVQYYEEEVRKLSENRFMPGWNFCNFFTVKESLAFMFEIANLREDALREYDELEQIYSETVNVPQVNATAFGGVDPGDDCAALLDVTRKPVNQLAADGTVLEFDFRQYLFSRQALLLFNLQRPAEVSGRGHSFIIFFAKILTQHEKDLPFCMREIWVITACLALVKATSRRFSAAIISQDTVKDFYRLQGDLYSYARTKLMRLADLIGYGHNIERSPCNSAALSMLPWPRPAVWPAVPPDISRVQAKEQMSPPKLSEGFGKLRKQLSLSPNVLLREANRRRSSLSVGSLAEMLALSRVSLKESPAADAADSAVAAVADAPSLPSTLPQESISGADSSSPEPLQKHNTIEPPMKLPEVQAAAEHALLTSISDETLRTALSSAEGFEDLFLDLTRAAADNFHRSWRKRHGVVLDGEVAAVHYRRGALDAAAKLYEKVCALYGSEGWHALLVQVLPRLSECQKKLSDWAGYLSSCIKLLSLDPGPVSSEDRISIQAEIVKLAYGGLPVPVSLDVSTLITFAARGGPPLELCEGDPGTLMVTVWSGFQDDITMDSLSLTLVTTFAADEGTKFVKSVDAPVLKPGKNRVLMTLPPQRPGSYVLGVLTGHIGQVKLRSHTYCTTSAASSKGGPPDSDDYLSNEKPLRTVLEVAKPRALVEIKPAITKGLLFGEAQWVGLIIRPLSYSLEGARVHISSGPNLQFLSDQTAMLEVSKMSQRDANAPSNIEVDAVKPGVQSIHHILENGDSLSKDDYVYGKLDSDSVLPQQLQMKDGCIELPDWARMVTSILWVQVKADSDGNLCSQFSGDSHLFSPPSPKKAPLVAPDLRIQDLTATSVANGPPSASDLVPASLKNGNIGHGHLLSNGSLVSRFGMKTLKVKMEFGVSRSRLYERTIAVQFTHPFRVSTRIVSRGNDGRFLLQITLNSQLAAAVTIKSANLVPQPGFAHVNNHEGQPTPAWLLPLSVSASSECALLFAIRSEPVTAKDGNGDNRSSSGAGHPKKVSCLNIQYKVSGNHEAGLQAPVTAGVANSESYLKFSSSFHLKMPVLEQLVAVGMLPVPSQCPCVGQQIVFQWRVERLKEGWAASQQQNSAENLSLPRAHSDQESEDLYYELKANEEYWMIAGRRKGFISLPPLVGSRIVLSMACVPLVAGHVHPPALRLVNIGRAHVSRSPAGPHLDIIEAESQLFVQTYARSPVVFVSGEGCKLYDTENKEYLDLTAGIAVNALGHGDPTWVKAVTEQAGKLAHVSNLFHSLPQVDLAKRLVKSSFADRIFMTNSGTEANEAAIKFARKYHHALAKRNGGNAQGATELIAFTNGFHGRTLGALALTSKVQYRTPFEPLVPGAQFVTFGDLEATRQAVVAGRTAAIFVEPLQGEGGVCSATASFLKGLREICDETETLLVFDEVQCGLGRTGRLWAHEAYDVKPDIMTLAKPLAGGLPIGAVLVTDRVASSIAAGDHGSTFAGGPLVCHAALAVLDRIQAPGFLESVAQKGAYLRSQLEEKLGKNPHVKEVRGEGLLVGIQLDVPASPLVAAALDAGLLILTASKGDVVRLAPPLIISIEEIDQAVGIIGSCMSSLQ